ncbi:hypothetical protein [Gracilibacillus kekensis]|uniref:DUF4367 domain-containing protein n=1 Tax=Gracilibacillus kekensis TaxID=1027249 RepID=A0A1M7JLL8_9BACI|nr:hypothetical protein [Gracilibacillus kekensis]SHM53914.1 hypothetical protein SAMN05216179_0407 [Gracilibacillus kekensis]
MSHNEDELKKELKELKTKRSLETEKKETMKMALQKHAKKKRAKSKAKQTFIWFSSAAAILICGILVFQMINNDQITLPADNNQEKEEIGITGDDNKESDEVDILDDGQDNNEAEDQGSEDTANETEDLSPLDFKVDKIGEGTHTILIEGMESEEPVAHYRMEPYGIEYSVDKFLDKYAIEDTTVRYHNDYDVEASIVMYVEENASIEQVFSNLQDDYTGESDGPYTLPEDENPYQGIGQDFSDTPEGFYVYQIEENVLVIQYEYDAEAGDGMPPRLDALQKSIK